VLKFVLLVALFAALVYALMWTLERRRVGGAERPTQSPPKPRRARPGRQLAPDDDEDFLRGLGRKGRNDSPE
jgi:hypothetical protein